ncbi:MAG: SDR family NAD(P)-dependent oxidoreductase [Gemmatimonadales bacterium]|nr:SDR family NAD(P)-dependent oxidoreductase [Gemmatimonadales bacterium]
MTSPLSSAKQALLAIEKLTARAEQAERANRQPIAIVGMGCRFPGGVDSPAVFWNLLARGDNAVTEIPPDRWDVDAYYDPDVEAPGKMNTRYGAFLRDIDRFDPAFFGISPREAASMDPQQRLLLEVVWEALEHAGQAPDRLSGTRTGVFVGIAGTDYAQLQLENGAIGSDTYYGSGVGHSVASGRISYVLGLQGPSVSIDTACSSSLVAVHLAVQSLRSGECSMALAGGTNAILAPETMIALAKYRMLAPDGRCKAFDAAADGFVRGEGVGVVVLKRLADAVAAGDTVLAVIRGSAVNQDGPSSGLTAPNGPAQVMVIRDALANGGVRPAEVSYVETHGTGTSLGDPIEVQALGTALGEGRPADRPLWIGSLKTNVGHMEASAGVAGLIKAVLCIQHRAIPPHLHFVTPSPFIPWAQLPVRVPTTLTPWPLETGLLAGVSSFGFSGTNAHLVVGPPPDLPAGSAAEPDRPRHLLTLSAAGESPLHELARRFADGLDDATPLADIAFTANTGRAALPYRCALVAESTAEARAALHEVAQGREAAGAMVRRATFHDQPRIAFLFSGQGAQYPAMGRSLYRTQPVFRAAIDRCDELLRPILPHPLLSVLFPDDAAAEARIHDTTYTQPGLFAIEYALAELLASLGIHATTVLGHSVGEYAAACRAGVFGLEDGLRLIAARGRLMGGLPAGGAMAAVLADRAVVEEAIAGTRLAIAAYNGPANTVISGAGVEVDAVCTALGARGITTRPLVVSHAFHSALMDPILDEFEAIAATVQYTAPSGRLLSNLSGGPADPAEVTTARYWRRHLREPVRFSAAMASLAAQGHEVFIEVGPHPTLISMARDSAPGDGRVWLPTLRRGKDDWTTLLATLGELWTHGVETDLYGLDAGAPRRRVSLPTYPFQRSSYWTRPAPAGRRAGSAEHPLLGARIRSALRDVVQFESTIAAGGVPFLADHRVDGRPILPATGFIEMLAAGSAAVFGEMRAIEDLVIREPLAFAPDERRLVQTVLRHSEGGGAEVEVSSTAESGDGTAWRLHATARLASARPESSGATDLAAVRARCLEPLTAVDHYGALAARGLDFGPSLRGVEAVWRCDGEAVADIVLPEAAGSAAGYRIHPALLDACLQGLAAAIPESIAARGAYLPLAVDRVAIHRTPGNRVTSVATVLLPQAASGSLTADIVIADADGVVAELGGVTLRPAPSVVSGRDGWTYELAWRAEPASAAEGFPAPAALERRTATELPILAEQHGLPTYHETYLEVEALATAFILRSFAELGWTFAVGEEVTTDGLLDRLGIVPRYRGLLIRYLVILAEDGILGRNGDRWAVRALPPVVDAAASTQSLLARRPASAAQITLTASCGSVLAEVLRGRADPLQYLFPGGSAELAESLYQHAPEALVYNGLVRASVAELVSGLPLDRRLRVLEVGGGTGATTSWVVPELPADRTEYLFTDLSPTLVARAREKFAAHRFVQCQTLDLERELAAQGVGAEGFDLIIAVNVIHATADLRATLGRIHRALAPGGTLLMLEVAAPERWIDVTFGLTEGWWRFTDRAIRPDYPLLDRAAWQRLFEDLGYEAVIAPPESPLSREALVIGRKPVDALPILGDPGDWLLVGDGGDVTAGLARHLTAAGHRTVEVREGDHDGFGRLVAARSATLRGVIHLGALAHDDSAIDATESVLEAQQATLGSIVAVVQSLGTHSFEHGAVPRLWLVTRGAVPVEGAEPVAVAQAPVWGLGRVVALEHPELGATRVDLDPRASMVDQARDLFRALGAPETEDQIAVRGGRRHWARIVPVSVRSTAPDPVRLAPSATGILDEIRLVPTARRVPGPGEVEIRVYAAGLNFRDVMNAVAMRADPEPLGGECAGRVVAVGPGVEHLAPGDDVVATGQGCFGTYVTVDARFVVLLPPTIGHEAAATVPFAFMTAHYALVTLAGLQRGERVLIHAGAGGVGMAAIQIAQRIGAEIFATAGSEEKRSYLRSLGIAHVFDSRSLRFAEEIRAVTHGRGVDVALNSLAGEFIPATASVLSPRGRFLEIGKREIWTDDDFRRVRPDGRYHAIDLARRHLDDPVGSSAAFADIMATLARGEITPLPRWTFPLERAAEGFRYMAQARHVGKVVLTVTAPDRAGLGSLSCHASYLVTGGLTGLGLLTAERLVERGARHLVLVGRRGPSEAAQQTIAGMEQAGAQVAVRRVDVSRPEAIAELLAEIDTTLPPLRGIVHSAGVLEDGALLQQSWDRFRIPLGPKVAGAWALHRGTCHRPLDFFVLYSSVASLLGSAGQGNHAAANAFMDGLAYYRRACGLPALSISWGAWSEVGAAVEHGVDRRIEAQGVGVIPPADGLALLEAAMEGAPPHLGVLPIDWNLFARRFEAGQRPGWVSEVVQDLHRTVSVAKSSIRPADQGTAGTGFIQRWAEAVPGRRRELLVDFVGDQVARVLGVQDGRAIDQRQPLNELGLDSLMAVELRNRLGTALGLTRSLPATLVFDHPTLDALAAFLETGVLAEAVGATGTTAPAEPAQEGTDAVGAIEDLSDAEVEALFARKMQGS